MRKTRKAFTHITGLAPNFAPRVLHPHALTVKTNQTLTNASSELPQLLQGKALMQLFQPSAKTAPFAHVTLFVFERISDKLRFLRLGYLAGVSLKTN